jgi:methylated-DNA-protein-cysteine methyltransferase-like protein
MKKQTDFTKRVYAVVAAIPKGKVATYGQVAKLAGNPGAARAVGMCMSHNKDTKTVPCHRVVGSTGRLTGYAYGNGISTKQKMLEKEGVVFKGANIDLARSGWKPK